MAWRYLLRRDNATNWTSVNPVLALGEPGFDETAKQLKMGDGLTAWNDLEYATDVAGGAAAAQAAAEAYADGQVSAEVTRADGKYVPSADISDDASTVRQDLSQGLADEVAGGTSPFAVAQRAAFGPPIPTVADYSAMTGMKVSGHRGSQATHVEHTVEGYTAAIAAFDALGRIPFVKTDATRLGGVGPSYAVMHDSTVNRTTNTTVANDLVSNYDIGTLKSLTNLTAAYGPAYPTPSRPMLLTEFLDLIGHRCVFSIEPKDGLQEAPAIAAQIVARGLADSCIIGDHDGTALTLPGLVHAVPGAENMVCGYSWSTQSISVVTPAAVIAAGYRGLAIQNTYSDADITTVVNAAHAAGLQVTSFPAVRREQVARLASLGVDGIDAADPAYLSTSVPLGPSRFRQGRTQAGFLDHDGSNGYVFVGGPGAYRLQLNGTPAGVNSSGYQLGFGFLGPLPDTFTLSGTLTWDQADANTGKFARFWLSVSDKTPNGSLENGYAFQLLQSGQAQISRSDRGAYDGAGNYAAGATGAIKNGATGPAPTAGTVLPFTISRAAGGVYTFVINGLTTTVTDALYVPRYVHMSRSGTAGASGLAFSVSNLSVA